MDDEKEKDEIVSKWEELKTVVEALDLDVLKNSRGTAAAGVRARKGFRDVKKRAAELVKMTVERDKALKATRPPRAKKAKADA